MPIELDSFTRIVTDSKYQFSVGSVVAILAVFPATPTTLICVSSIAVATILAEGLRDFAKWTPIPRPTNPTVVQTGEFPTAGGTTVASGAPTTEPPAHVTASTGPTNPLLTRKP